MTTHWKRRLFVDALLAAAVAVAGSLCLHVARGETLSEGVKLRSATKTIERTNGDIVVPPTYQGTASASPADELAGAGIGKTILRFAPDVKGRLVETRDFGLGITHWFNDGKAKPCQCAYVHDLSIDGQAGFHNYPDVALSKPDPHGPDFTPRADGIALNGNGSRVEMVHLFQIPGTGIVIVDGGGTQAGAQAIFDSITTRVIDDTVAFACNGLRVAISDAQVTRVNCWDIVKDAIINDGAGTSYSDCHTWGSDRGLVANAVVDINGCYFEAARIGTYLAPAAANSRITGLRIGPATCYQRGVLCEANKCDMTGVMGLVKAGAVGVELKAIGDTLDAQLSPQPDGTCMQVSGSRHRVRLHTGWGEHNAVGVKAGGPLTASCVEITGAGAGGTVLDLADSKLDTTNGRGNVFRITWDDWKGTTVLVKYPGGGTKYNLAAGNELYINGELQK